MVDKSGKKTGGRAKGVVNKATIERERARLAAAVETAKAVKAVGGLKLGIAEMQKALVLAEGMARAYRPDITEKDGKVTLTGGDAKLFRDWFESWFNVMKELTKYQAPTYKAVDAPTPPPDPAEMEQQRNAPPRKRLTLRIFEGGRLISGPPDPKRAADS